jgi:hypothetical protein
MPYPNSAQKYYQANKDEILEKEKEKKRWLDYYERNKEAVRKRNLERYYKKKQATAPAPPPDDAKIERLNAILAELKELVPSLVKIRRRKNSPTSVVPPTPVVPTDSPAVLPPTPI